MRPLEHDVTSARKGSGFFFLYAAKGLAGSGIDSAKRRCESDYPFLSERPNFSRILSCCLGSGSASTKSSSVSHWRCLEHLSCTLSSNGISAERRGVHNSERCDSPPGGRNTVNAIEVSADRATDIRKGPPARKRSRYARRRSPQGRARAGPSSILRDQPFAIKPERGSHSLWTKCTDALVEGPYDTAVAHPDISHFRRTARDDS